MIGLRKFRNLVMEEKKTVLLGMSGGVDSSVAALLLKNKGYKVIGAFMKNFSDTKNPLTGECNYIEERKMAQKIASLLKIPLITLDYEKEYKKSVLDPMFRAYSKGLTPNPDIDCNKKIKFPVLRREARRLNADFIATGHYARTKRTREGVSLYKGKDEAKDQSYFLYELTQKDLDKTLFPLGNLTKKEVREIARENDFPNYNKLGSRGICFVGKTDMKTFLQKKIPKKKGNVKDPEGNFIGTHEGIMYYTIGQRIGPSIGIEIFPKKDKIKKWYVAKKEKNNTLIVAPEGHLLLKKSKMILNNLHLINPKEKIPSEVKVRIRHLGKLHSAVLNKKSECYVIKLKKPVEGIAEGQSAVIYKGEKVIGGGEIAETKD